MGYDEKMVRKGLGEPREGLLQQGEYHLILGREHATDLADSAPHHGRADGRVAVPGRSARPPRAASQPVVETVPRRAGGYPGKPESSMRGPVPTVPDERRSHVGRHGDADRSDRCRQRIGRADLGRPQVTLHQSPSS